MAIKLTKEQKTAVKQICKFINNTKSGSPKWMTLDGKAGVGKTTVLIEIIKKYYISKTVIAGALAHKAKSVLSRKFSDVIKNDSSVRFYSVAAMLGMKLNEETGEFEYAGTSDVPIESADLVIIDECSMISGKQMSYILSLAKDNSKIIFSGDIGQLPPIGDSDEVSPTFATENIVHLHTRMRQAEESPILPYSDYYWNSIVENLDYVSNAPISNNINDYGGIYFSSKNSAIESFLPVFKKAVATENIDLVKYVCYRNIVRIGVNKYIRSQVFGNDVEDYVPGDFIIFMSYFQWDENSVISKMIDNSSEYIVETAEKKVGYFDGIELSYWILGLKGVDTVVPVLANESKSDFDAHIKMKFKKAFEIKDKMKKKAALSAVWKLKRSFADIDYSYAITSHKSQGSTYASVIVDKLDIMSNNLTSMATKYRSMYTSITRASKICTIIDRY